MRSTGHAWCYKAWCSAVISCFYNSSDWCISILAVSLSDLLPRRSTVAQLSCCVFLFFFYRGHPRFWNFYSTIPVDVVRVKSYMNCLFDSARVLIRVTINKLYLVLKKSLYVTCSSDQRSVRPNINQWKIFSKKNSPLEDRKLNILLFFETLCCCYLGSLFQVWLRGYWPKIGTRKELNFKKDRLL